MLVTEFLEQNRINVKKEDIIIFEKGDDFLEEQETSPFFQNEKRRVKLIKNTFEVKQGIKTHIIENSLFKTNIICVLLTVPLNIENVTQNALIPFLIRSGSKRYKTQLEINKHLEEMYGASFDLRN